MLEFGANHIHWACISRHWILSAKMAPARFAVYILNLNGKLEAGQTVHGGNQVAKSETGMSGIPSSA
jgi:hypothetical protein